MLVTRKMCMTKDIGCNGNLFGGNMMAWIDEAAAIFAHLETEEKTMVTVKFDELVFKHPVRVGDIITFECLNAELGKTSIKFDVLVINEAKKVICSTKCVFVAVDENGNSKELDRKEKS